MAKLPFIFYPDSVRPLGQAASGDYRLLAERLRAGIATPPELAFAADIIEGKRKRAAHRPRINFERDLKFYEFVAEQMRSGLSKDKAVAAAESEFEMTKNTINSALRKMVRGFETSE